MKKITKICVLKKKNRKTIVQEPDLAFCFIDHLRRYTLLEAVTHAWNPNYLGGGDQDNCGLRLARAKSY
jgi:hypothetical protein